MSTAAAETDMDWLDLRDPRSQTEQTTTTSPATITDINKAFDEIAGLFEVYPPPPPPLKNRGKTLHLNTRKTKSK